jgi:WD40 repeat protein
MQFSFEDPNILYTSSYDSSLRRLDLQKGQAIEVYAPQDLSEDAPISGVQLANNNPNNLYFATLEGAFGVHDIRTPSHEAERYQLSEKKIGGFSLHPLQPHLVATASLDRTLKLWDLRKVSGGKAHRMPALLGEHESRLSVSHAVFNYAGQVATASYDDTIKIHDFSNCAEWDVGKELKPGQMKPTAVIPHNNQTGRWVTMSVAQIKQNRLFYQLMYYSLKAQWQMQPQDGVQRFCIGNMNRFVDLYTSKGEQLAQLGGDGITAVPAVAQFHPSMDWVAAGTASGKLCLWM